VLAYLGRPGRREDQAMTVAANEFIRRFLLHVLPDGFHGIRHYGFLANDGRSDHLARSRQLLDARVTAVAPEPPTSPRTRSEPPISPRGDARGL
jgi:hypothetical protein